MRFIVNILILLVLIGFCFYWFNDQNSDRHDPSCIPYVGDILMTISEKYTEFQFYFDSGQGNLWSFLSNLDEVRQISDKFKEIYDSGRNSYQP